MRDGWRPRLLFVAPGTYRGCLFLSGEERWRDWGAVPVRRGGITRVDLPPGKIYVRIRGAGKGAPRVLELVAVTPGIRPRRARARIGAGGTTGAVWLQYLEAGSYRIELDSESYLPVRREVDVGEEVAWVEIDLQRAR